MSVNRIVSGEAAVPAEYYVRDWALLGPFSFRDTPYSEPGDARILGQSFAEDEAALDTGQAGQGWRQIQRQSNWVSEWAHIDCELGGDTHPRKDLWESLACSAAYVAAVIESDEAVPDATLLFAAGGYYKVWWNGAELYHYGEDGARLHGSDLDQRPVQIGKGRNVLVVKSCNFRGPWKLSAQIAGPDGGPFRIHSPQAASLESPGLRVTITERKPIRRVVALRGAPTVLVRPDGEIVAYEDMGEDTRRMGSTDNGRSFRTAQSFPKDAGVEMADGSLYHIGHPTTDADGNFLADAYRWEPDRKLLRGPLEVPVDVPGARRWAYDDQCNVSGAGFSFHCYIRTRDDRLLAATHCYWEGDIALDEDAVGLTKDSASLGFTKPRLILLESVDQGESWRLLSTIARHPELGPEGWFEPALVELANGDLLVVARNGAMHWPLWQSRSGDGGRTWGEPEKLEMLGVYPQIRLLSNGVLALATIRPYMALSLDPTGTGRSWSHHVTIATTNNCGRGGLVSIAEQKPDTVLCALYEEFPVVPPVRGLTRDLFMALVKVHVARV